MIVAIGAVYCVAARLVFGRLRPSRVADAGARSLAPFGAATVVAALWLPALLAGCTLLAVDAAVSRR